MISRKIYSSSNPLAIKAKKEIEEMKNLAVLRRDREREFRESMENTNNAEVPYEYRKMIYQDYKIKRR